MIARLVLAFLLALAPAALAQTEIARTVHNLTPEGPGTMKESATTGLCVFCHTPHNGSPVRSMWNREMPGITYQLYSSTTTRAACCSAVRSAFSGNGRNEQMDTEPTRMPRRRIASTASCTVPLTEPSATTMVSASSVR